MPNEDNVSTKGSTHSKETSHAQVPGDKTDESFDFRLFAKSSQSLAENLPSLNAGENLPKIILRSPSPANKEPGFFNPSRPEEYYFTGFSNVEQADRFRQSAVSGEHILGGLEKSWVCSVIVDFCFHADSSRSPVCSCHGV